MPILTGRQIGELQNLLVGAFEIRELERLMLEQLEVNLSHIVAVSQSNLDVSYDLIIWLEHRDLTLKFLTAVRSERSEVEDIIRFCEQFQVPVVLDSRMAPTAIIASPSQLTSLVTEFRTVFEERRKWFDCLNAYKTLHDVLHKLRDQHVAVVLAVERFRRRRMTP